MSLPTIQKLIVNGSESKENSSKNTKFQTERQAFDITYIKFDYAQKSLNQGVLNNIIEIITKSYQQRPRPMSIADICCGYGLQTITMREKLLKNGVQIQKMVGYDISKDMIEYAETKNTFPEVKFLKKNVQVQFDDFEEYDVVICLYGIHWMNDMEKAIAAMHRSLKAGGLFFSQICLEAKDFFDLRQQFVINSQWSSAFSESAKILPSFLLDKADLLAVLTKYFISTYQQYKPSKFEFTRHTLINSLQSWLTEVRHLTSEVSHPLKKEAIGRAYLEDFVDSIDKNLTGNITIREDGSITYYQIIFGFYGTKI